MCNHALSGGSYQPLRVAKGARGVRSLRGKPSALESIRGEPPHQYSRAAICSRSLTPSPLRAGGGLGQSKNRRPAPTGRHVARLMVIKREYGTSFQTSGFRLSVRGIISKWRIIRRRWRTQNTTACTGNTAFASELSLSLLLSLRRVKSSKAIFASCIRNMNRFGT